MYWNLWGQFGVTPEYIKYKKLKGETVSVTDFYWSDKAKNVFIQPHFIIRLFPLLKQNKQWHGWILDCAPVDMHKMLYYKEKGLAPPIKIATVPKPVINQTPKVLRGEVQWFNPKLGYGFIKSGGVTYFAHYNDIVEMGGYKKLKAKQLVEFVTQQNKNKSQVQAKEIRVIGQGPVPRITTN
jgi:cold shock CspA family protein